MYCYRHESGFFNFKIGIYAHVEIATLKNDGLIILTIRTIFLYIEKGIEKFLYSIY